MRKRIEYPVSDLLIRPLASTDDLSSFSCGVNSLDDFFQKEVVFCHKHGYLTAYVVRSKNNKCIIGMFALSNDVISLEEDDVEEIKGKIDDEYKFMLDRQASFPAVNISHLAVSTDYQGKGIGRIIVSYIIAMVKRLRFSGVQFLTVDSMNNPRTNKFYLDLDFSNRSFDDMGEETRRMFLSIMDYK